MADKIWKPDTFFVNEESAEVKQSFVRIKPSGEVLFSQRIVVSKDQPSFLNTLRIFRMTRCRSVFK